MKSKFFEDYRKENGFDYVETIDMFMPDKNISSTIVNISCGLDLIKQYLDGNKKVKLSEILEIIFILEKELDTLRECNTKCGCLQGYSKVRRYFDQHTMATDFGEISMNGNTLHINDFALEYDESKYPIDNLEKLIEEYKQTL